jgi:DNA-binding NtrC family response regulator
MQCLVARFRDDVRRFPLPDESATIGKLPENDIVLPFKGVSRHHALLTRTEGGLLLTDRGSTNGIVHGDVRVSKVLLTPGETIHLGPALLSIEDADTDELRVGLMSREAPSEGEPAPETEGLLPNATETDAIALIAKIERAGQGARRSAQNIALEARALLRATTFCLVESTNDALAFAAVAGALPEEGLLLDLLKLGRDARRLDGDIRRFGPRTLLMTARSRGKRTSLLAAIFEGPPRAFAAWEKSLFAFLAAKLLDARDERGAAVEEIAPLPAGGLVFESKAMRETVQRALSFSKMRRPILIQGETGTGKELLARLLHDSGPFARGPFLTENCAGLSKDLLESELFGIEKGAATSVDARPGLFDTANGGTLFLDEVGELPHAFQAALLRVAEHGELRPVGGRVPRKVTLRVVFATNRESGPEGPVPTVRPDLSFRCAVIPVPPLRHRPEDIVPLATHFLERFARAAKVPSPSLSVKAVRHLVEHRWSGNVRELENAMEEAVLRFGHGGILQSEHIAAILQVRDACETPETAEGSLHEERDRSERQRVERALRDGRTKAGAARLLGMSRNGLRKMMTRLGLE